MLPSTHAHPLSPLPSDDPSLHSPPDSAPSSTHGTQPIPLSQSSSSIATILSSSPSSSPSPAAREPLFPSSIPHHGSGDYFTARKGSNQASARPELESQTTFKPSAFRNSGLTEEVATASSFSLPMAPHLLPASSPLLTSIPQSLLLSIFQSLSASETDARLEVEKKDKELDALKEILKDKGVGEGEVERARVRARAEIKVGEPKEKEWRIDLQRYGARRSSVAPSDKDEGGAEGGAKAVVVDPSLDLDDLAEAISSDHTFSYTLPSAFPQAEVPSPPLSDPQGISTSLPSTSDRSVTSSSLPPGEVNGHTVGRRPRHASLSSRLFGSLIAPSSSPPPSSSSSFLSSGTSTVSSTPTSKHRQHRKPRTGSIASMSSVASDESAARRDSAGGYGDWLPWRGKKEKTRLGEEVASLHSETEREAPAETESPPGEERLTARLRASSTSSSTNKVTTSTASLHSHSTTTTSHDSSASSSPPSSDTPRPPTSPTLSRKSMSVSRVPASPTLSTPTPTSTMSTALWLPSSPQMSRSVSQSSRTGSRSPARKRGKAEDNARLRPSHFEAVVLSATKWLEEKGVDAIVEGIWGRRQVSEKVDTLGRELMRGVAASTSAPSSDLITARAEDASSERRIPKSDSKPTLVLEKAVPLYSASDAGDKAKEKSYASTARHTLGRALGLGASTTSSLSSLSLPSAAASSLHSLSLARNNRSTSTSTSHSASSTANKATTPNLTLFPKMSTLSRYSPFAQPALSTPSTVVSLSSHSTPLPSMPSSPASNTTSHSSAQPSRSSGTTMTMELSTIPTEAAPPTLALLNNSIARNGKPRRLDLDGVAKEADEEDEEEGPMVDRYGFVYDIRSGMRLLRAARKRKERKEELNGKTSSSSLSAKSALGSGGLVEPSIENEESDPAQDEVLAELEVLREALGLPPSAMSPPGPRSPVPRQAPLPPLSKVPEERSSSSSLPLPSSTSSTSINGSTMASPPSSQPPPRPSRLVRSTSSDLDFRNPPLDPSSTIGHQSMKRLLGQLVDMHDAQEKVAKKDWEAFIKRRQAKLKSTGVAGEEKGDEGWESENLVGVAQMGTGSKGGKEDWVEFKSLVRKGVPIAFRPKIWAECSGANEAREPGLYQELLARHGGEENMCLNQIDMDCHRTFPTNVFFAGTGPGVKKLRNVLIAYSWRNPTIGYCQGMNNLTATLLLTHPAEEDAFWVLVCIIEKILPSDYYTSHLLVSQADQRVLRDLVERHMPDLSAHLEELGVELPAITFGWFLSLFTDALPIQTLLRVWDLLFVFGTVTLFRVAIGILKMNEPEILACDSAATLYALMRTLTTHLYQVDRLLKIACEDLRTVVKDRDVSILRNRHVSELMLELGLSPDEEDAASAT